MIIFVLDTSRNAENINIDISQFYGIPAFRGFTVYRYFTVLLYTGTLQFYNTCTGISWYFTLFTNFTFYIFLCR